MTHYLEVIHRPEASESFFSELEKISGLNLKLYADNIVDYLEKIASPKITLYPGKKMDKTLDILFGRSFLDLANIQRKGVGISLGKELLKPEAADGLRALEELHPGITGRIKKLGGVVFVPSPASINEMRYQMARYQGLGDKGAKRYRKVEEFMMGSGKEASRDISAHELKHHERRLKNPTLFDMTDKKRSPLKRLADLTKEEAIAYSTGAMSRKGVGGKIRGSLNAASGFPMSVGMHAPRLIDEAKSNFMRNPAVRDSIRYFKQGHQKMKRSIKKPPPYSVSFPPKPKSVGPKPSKGRDYRAISQALDKNMMKKIKAQMAKKR